jgi:2-polyprenyl-3-methyl-5-hydroxy-6-metoxy-1,4-benzoquinol methylase
MKDNTLERIIPDQLDGKDAFDRLTLQLHLERYLFAVRYARPGRLLDMACGTGYGAYQIMQSDKFTDSHIRAVDISEDAIEYGRKRYAHPSIEFVRADALEYTDHSLYDSIVSLETIEHLKDTNSFVKKLYSLLKKDGVLIISAPITPSTDGNPHHFSDFTNRGFKKLFSESGFSIMAEQLQVQSYSFRSLLDSKNKRLSQTRHQLFKFYLQNPAVFFARIRSLFKDGFKNKYLILALQKK